MEGNPVRRIALAQIVQESNSFNPKASTLSEFEPFGIAVGHEVVDRFGDSDEAGGFVDSLRAWDEPAQPVGLVRAHGWSYGPLSPETRQWFADRLREQLCAAGQVDGLLLAMHGSLIAQDEDDVEGSWLQVARSIVGPDLPIVVSLDMHGYLTSAMLDHATAFVAYHANPHVDRRQTGQRAGNVLQRLLAGARPTHAAFRLPMISLAEVQNTFGEVLKPVFDRVREMEAEPEVLSASVLMTQAFLDVPVLGWSMLVYTDDDRERATAYARELSDMCWCRRPQLAKATFHTPEQAVSKALACPGRPVVFADGPDSTNSGACGDSVHLLKVFASQAIPDGALTFMVDPEAVAHACEAGVGGEFDMPVGGKRDNVFSSPLPLHGTVKAISHVRFILDGHLGDNMPIDMGRGAVVCSGDATVVFTESSGPGSTPKLYRAMGLEPRDFKIVVAKSPAGFRAEYEPFAAEIILTRSPGPASPDFAGLPFRRIDRPLWPLDEIEDWQAVDWAASAL